MTKLSPFALVIMPPVWTWSAGLFLSPLATALGSAYPDLVSSAVQCLVFTTSAILSGWVMGQAARGEVAPEETHEMSTSEMLAALREGREQERAEAKREPDYKYEFTTRPGQFALGLANGKHTQVFRFPAGITMEHLTAFGDVIARGEPPRYRKLKETFDHTQWATLRDWLMVAEINKFAVMAEYTDGRDGWDVTPIGRKLAIMWRCSSSPTPLLSSAKKCMIERNKTILER